MKPDMEVLGARVGARRVNFGRVNAEVWGISILWRAWLGSFDKGGESGKSYLGPLDEEGDSGNAPLRHWDGGFLEININLVKP